MNVDQWLSADLAWSALRESGQSIHSDKVPGATYDTAYYQLSDREFRMLCPRPLFKDFLIANKGMNSEPEAHTVYHVA